jgi:purine-nucleoside phosphorylase
MQISYIDEAARFLQSKGITQPQVAIVLGTGLGALVNEVQTEVEVPYESIPHFPVSTVEFHKGRLIYGQLNGRSVVVLQGRFHYYEGYSLQEVTFPIRVLKALGASTLLLSNAAGGMNPDFRKGDLVITEDHINLLPDNPLRGLPAEFGNRFVDMSEPYDTGLRALLARHFEASGIPAKTGVYVSVMGPNLETRAEYRWLRSMSADMVGMSTVPEVIVAGQVGMRCAAVSVITDECDPDHLKPVNIAEIIEVAGQADKKLSNIFTALMQDL